MTRRLVSIALGRRNAGVARLATAGPPARRAGRPRVVRLAVLIVALALPAAGADVNFAGSAYVDYWWASSPGATKSSLMGITPEAAVKMEVDVHENLSFSARVCFSCHGLEVDRAHVDFTPSPAFNIQAGRIGVPFGEMAVRYDPTSHRSVSKPLIYDMGRMAYYGRGGFNLGVVPQPYVDTGVVVYGQVWPSDEVQLWYAGYVVGGMRGENDFDYAAMRTSFYVDNNNEPAGGGRAVMTISSSEPDSVFKDFSLGISGMYGHYDPLRRRAYTALGADASLRVGPVTLRSEAAFIRIELNPDPTLYRYELIDTYLDKGGFFVELEHPLGSRVAVLYRFDMLARKGIPLPSSDVSLSPDSRILRYTQAFQFLLSSSMYVKASYEYTYMNDFPSFHSFHAGVGGSF